MDFLELKNRHTGEILRIRRIRDAAGQVVLALDGWLPPKGNGPPAHIHFQELEEGVVKAGLLGAEVGNQKIVVRAGESTTFPAGVVHRWWNAGEDLLEFSGRAIPAVDLDRYLQAVFAVLNASASGRPSIFYIAHVAWRHRHTQVLMMPPPAVQRIVFPLVLLIGRMLGKYKGDRWPGSPESCKGAPEIAAQQA